MALDEDALKGDIAAPRFRSGEDRNRWRLRDIRWPYLYVTVFARDGRGFLVRLNCAGYPANPPTGTFWDFDNDRILPFPSWPKGTGRVTASLRTDWQNGAALYIPCDRVSINGHDNWRSVYPSMIWNPKRGITQYLEIVHDLLHSRDYICAEATHS